MDQTTDLQAQVIALRTAVESLWLSMLYNNPDRVAHAERLHGGAIAALGNLRPDNDEGAALLGAVVQHTHQLWSRIEAQLGVAPGPGTYRPEA